jgi:ATP-dependent DNA helicase RecQ
LAIHNILQQYWGYNSFRPLQQDIIQAILDGNDVLALLPTGGGKSICFQVPAMTKEGICLVISPLIALMKDQVETLKRKGIPALCVYAGMSFIEVKNTLQNAAYGNYKFLYVSPERLETNLFLEYLPAMNVCLIAVDEAHCISQWGYDFRPPYLRIAAIREFLPKVPIIALTASAVKAVQEDICTSLQFGTTHQIFQQTFVRPNLSYSAFNTPDKFNKLLDILQKVKGSGIVYCKSRKQAKEIADFLKQHKIAADFYHAGLSNEERNNKQDSWIKNNIRIIACTNAFGMGIDKPDVRVVVHVAVPDCLENYYQEAGRAGRDGKRAYAVLLYNEKELTDLQGQSKVRYPDDAAIKHTYTSIMNYLQIPAGHGEGNSYNFDIALYCKAFKQLVLPSTYAIKVLEQENICCLSEMFFKPATISFTCTKEDINDIQKNHPHLEPIIKGLLRSYEGVFDNVVSIHEKKLASFVQLPVQDINKALQQLHSWGIVDYQPQKETPQITLLQNRMYADSFRIDLSNYLKRKTIFEERVKHMVEFTTTTHVCRSQTIAHYFTNEKVNTCGICDNCINAQDAVLSKEEFTGISNTIINTITSNGIILSKLIDSFWEVFNYLQTEEKIVVDKNSFVQILINRNRLQ